MGGPDLQPPRISTHTFMGYLLTSFNHFKSKTGIIVQTSAISTSPELMVLVNIKIDEVLWSLLLCCCNIRFRSDYLYYFVAPGIRFRSVGCPSL